MSITRDFIDELQAESVHTRRVLERVPEEKFNWRPHAKSMSAGQLALHVAELPRGIISLLTQLEVEVPTVPLSEPASLDEVLKDLQANVEYAASTLADWGDEGLNAEWRMTSNGHVVLKLPRRAMIRSILLNQMIHHRGQLTVYLRLLGAPVPAIYGPSADEPVPW